MILLFAYPIAASSFPIFSFSAMIASRRWQKLQLALMKSSVEHANIHKSDVPSRLESKCWTSLFLFHNDPASGVSCAQLMLLPMIDHPSCTGGLELLERSLHRSMFTFKDFDLLGL
jgi:hypothetical protein